MSALPAFDLNSASVDALVERHPTIGLFVAEDIVAWREKNGPVESVNTLVALGVTVELAAELLPAAATQAIIEPDVFITPEPATHDVRRPKVLPPDPPAVAEPSRAVSQTMRTTPTPVPVPIPAVANMPVEAVQIPAPARRFGFFYPIAVLVLVMGNAGLGAALVGLRNDEHEGRAPIAAMQVDVKELQANQADAAAHIAAHIEDTRTRLDKQETTLAKTIEKLDDHEQHEREAEHKAKEQAEHEAKEIGALNTRIGRVERQFDRNVYTVEEVVKLVDLSEGSSTHLTKDNAERPAKAPKSEHATPEEHAPAAHGSALHKSVAIAEHAIAEHASAAHAPAAHASPAEPDAHHAGHSH